MRASSSREPNGFTSVIVRADFQQQNLVDLFSDRAQHDDRRLMFPARS